MICSRCKQDKPTEAFGRNRSKASGYQSYCKECFAAYQANLPDEVRAKKLERSKAWQKANPDRVSEINARHFQKRKAPSRWSDQQRQNAWRKANPEKRKAQSARHYQNQKARCHAAVVARRAKQLNAIPAWADYTAIRAIYADAKRRNQRGARVHVDHIVPLINPLVCGLHVEANLQIIPAIDNWSKNNRHWPDMP